MDVKTTRDFDDWLTGAGAKLGALVDDRLDRIKNDNHFGDVRNLKEGLCELRWKNGLRVYFGYVLADDDKIALMLLGGNKNGQQRDIKRARRILDAISA